METDEPRQVGEDRRKMKILQNNIDKKEKSEYKKYFR